MTAQNDFRMPAEISPEQAAQAMLAGWASGTFEIHFPKRFTGLMKALRLLGDGAYFRLTLGPADLDHLAALYAEDCRFKDPFNEVRGRAAVRRVFAHMFETVEAPRFVVNEVFVEGDQCFLGWDFHAGEFVIRGASHLHFDATGLVVAH
eukprot:gene18024-22062_t